MHRIQEKGTCPNDQDLKLVGTQSVYSWRANLKKDMFQPDPMKIRVFG